LKVRRAATALLAAALLAAACGPGRAPAPESSAGPPVKLELEALDGGEVDLASYRGRIVVVHVFATWAPAAHGDVDQLTAAMRDRAPDLVVVGIALDPEGHRFVSPWRRAAGVTYLILLADDRVRAGQSGIGRVREVPTTLVLDRKGRVVARIERALAPGELEELLGRCRGGPCPP
jgi:peroxiredoxin